MNFYFAPMEGLSGFVYRKAHRQFFPGVDKYFSPFIFSRHHGGFTTRELKDILPENNQGIVLVPQILTNNAHDFKMVAKNIQAMGYEEININLGCPAGTVVAKHRGAGFLAKRAELDAFLAEVYATANTKVSIKTRIGKDDPEEFFQLLEIYNRYPIHELIIHPRTQRDSYDDQPNLPIFKAAVATSKNPICYNGDIFTAENFQRLTKDCPQVNAVMLGRGLLINPGLVHDIVKHVPMEKNRLKDFHDAVYVGYQDILSGERNVLFRMKELWSYMILNFTNNAQYAKKIKKAVHLVDYEAAVDRLFKEQDLCS